MSLVLGSQKYCLNEQERWLAPRALPPLTLYVCQSKSKKTDGCLHRRVNKGGTV